MKRVLSLLFFIAAALNAEGLTVAAAANVQYAVDELCRAFERSSGVEVKMVSASSGKLTAQIARGAPYDILLSADMRYPLYLKRKGFAITEPKVYAHGKLVLWSLKGVDLKRGLESLKDERVSHIAIPNPKTAPYGREALKALKAAGVYEDIRDRLVYAESVSQTNRYIASKAVEVGITAKSVLFSPKMRGVGEYEEIESSLYEPVLQGAVLLKHAKKSGMKEARAFYDFIFGEEAKEIFKKYGYLLP